jgi:hypothetical protein
MSAFILAHLLILTVFPADELAIEPRHVHLLKSVSPGELGISTEKMQGLLDDVAAIKSLGLRDENKAIIEQCTKSLGKDGTIKLLRCYYSKHNCTAIIYDKWLANHVSLTKDQARSLNQLVDTLIAHRVMAGKRLEHSILEDELKRSFSVRAGELSARTSDLLSNLQKEKLSSLVNKEYANTSGDTLYKYALGRVKYKIKNVDAVMNYDNSNIVHVIVNSKSARDIVGVEHVNDKLKAIYNRHTEFIIRCAKDAEYLDHDQLAKRMASVPKLYYQHRLAQQKELSAALDSVIFDRLLVLESQLRGSGHLVSIEMVKKLGISEGQQNDIQRLVSKALANSKESIGPSRWDRYFHTRSIIDTCVKEVLNEKQLKAWNSMQGTVISNDTIKRILEEVSLAKISR